MRWNSVLLMTIGILLEFGMRMLSGKRPRLRSFFCLVACTGPRQRRALHAASHNEYKRIQNLILYDKILFCKIESDLLYIIWGSGGVPPDWRQAGYIAFLVFSILGPARQEYLFGFFVFAALLAFLMGGTTTPPIGCFVLCDAVS